MAVVAGGRRRKAAKTGKSGAEAGNVGGRGDGGFVVGGGLGDLVAGKSDASKLGEG